MTVNKTLPKILPDCYNKCPRRTVLQPKDCTPDYTGIVSARYIHQMQQESFWARWFPKQGPFWAQWFPKLMKSADPMLPLKSPSGLGPSLEIPITLGKHNPTMCSGPKANYEHCRV